MLNESRTKKALYITLSGIILQIIRSVLGFAIRWSFNEVLGEELLGLNSLFSSILGMLTLTELGIGSAISIFLYEAFAKGDNESVKSYMKLFGFAYRLVGGVTLLGGVIITPIVLGLVNGSYDRSEIVWAWFFYIIAVATSYLLWADQRTLFIANQREYTVISITGFFYVIFSILQIVFLFLNHNYFTFLILNIINNIVTNVVIHKKAIKDYPFILECYKFLSKEQMSAFWMKWKALIIYNLSTYLIQSCDNIIISVVLGTVSVAYYNNYALIFNMVFAISATMSGAIVAGIGNVYFTDKSRLREIINKLSLFQHLIFSVTGVSMICVSSEFVNVFFGQNSVLSVVFVFIWGITYYFYGYFNIYEAVRKGIGDYENDQWSLLVLSILNIVISLVASIWLGVAGVLLGTMIVYLVRGGVFTAKRIYNSEVMGTHIREFYINLVRNSLLFILSAIFCYWISIKIVLNFIIFGLLVKCVICCSIVLFINWVVYKKTTEWGNVRDLVGTILGKIIHRGRQKK